MLMLYFLLGAASFSGSYFLIWKKVNLHAAASSFMSLGGLAGLLICLLLKMSFFQCLTGFFSGQAIGAITLMLNRRIQLPGFLDFSLWNPKMAQSLLSFALAVAASGAASMLAQYSLVHWALEEFGAESMGKWMAMNRLADAFNIPILAVANSILLPTLSGLAANKSGLKSFLQPVFRQSMLLLLPGFLLLRVLYPWLLQLFFSEEFKVDSSLIPWQLAGDFFRSSTCVFAVLMLAMGHTRFYLWLEIASSVFLIMLTRLLYPAMGFDALFVVHAVRYFLYWFIIVFRYRTIFFG
jgi:PST family polysaccharide transporter